MYLTDKTILITGGVGTIGRELIDQLVPFGPTEIRVVDNNETEIFYLEEQVFQRLRSSMDCARGGKQPRLTAAMADIRDAERMYRLMEGVDIVFHCAALKHVIVCERSPDEAIQTNIGGVRNIIAAARHNAVHKVIFTSSDKAVNPTNVMGTSKLMGERLISAANNAAGARHTIFSSTRFGNVLGSRGSVFPLFLHQIRSGTVVTLTDPEMTRFVMTAEDAVKLVIEGGERACGGEVFVTKMPIIRIEDLAHVMVDLLAGTVGRSPADYTIRVTGIKPGEKLYEELMSEEETARAVELPDMYAILPAFRGEYRQISYRYPELVSEKVGQPYVSSRFPAMTREELGRYIVEKRLIEKLDEGILA